MNDSSFDSTAIPHSDNDGAVAAGSSRKRKAAGASGRGVASLTPEQLAKKRANDREAQRAIRERTKNTIEALERRIHDLTSQQPYQELQAIIRQKEAVQAENEEIRKRLASVVSILQPLIGAQALAAENVSGRKSQSNNGGQPDAVLDLAQAAQHHVHMALGQPSPTFHPDQYMNGGLPSRSVPNQAASMPPAATDVSSYQSPFSSSDHDPGSDSQPWQNSRTALTNQRETMQRSHELSENGERLNFSFLIDSALQGKAGLVPTLPDRRNSPAIRSAQPPLPHPPSDTPAAWSMLPKNCPPTCPLDHILLNFLKARQREVAGYASAPGGRDPAYNSPAYPSISNLLNPSNTTTSAGTSSPGLSRHIPNPTSAAQSSSRPDPLSSLMTDIISKFPNISCLPEQVAITFHMFLLMRWQIYPTPENYHRIPEWLTPRPSQLFSPHPAWIDNLPWPRMRDRLVHNYEAYPFENWFLPFTAGLSVNWPYEAADCLISTEDGGEPMINPVFERHIYRLENWSVSPQFVEAFPDLADIVTVRDKSGQVNIPLNSSHMPQGLPIVGNGIALPIPQAQYQHRPASLQGQGTTNGSDAGG